MRRVLRIILADGGGLNEHAGQAGLLHRGDKSNFHILGKEVFHPGDVLFPQGQLVKHPQKVPALAGGKVLGDLKGFPHLAQQVPGRRLRPLPQGIGARINVGEHPVGLNVRPLHGVAQPGEAGALGLAGLQELIVGHGSPGDGQGVLPLHPVLPAQA